MGPRIARREARRRRRRRWKASEVSTDGRRRVRARGGRRRFVLSGRLGRVLGEGGARAGPCVGHSLVLAGRERLVDVLVFLLTLGRLLKVNEGQRVADLRCLRANEPALGRRRARSGAQPGLKAWRREHDVATSGSRRSHWRKRERGVVGRPSRGEASLSREQSREDPAIYTRRASTPTPERAGSIASRALETPARPQSRM